MNDEILKAEKELEGLLKNKIRKLRSQRKYIRVRGQLVPNNGIDSQTGKPKKDDNDGVL